MLSSKKSDAGSSSSSSSSSGGAVGGDRVPMSDAQTGPSASSAGVLDVKKKERSSPSGEPGSGPLPHQAGPGGTDQDSAEVRRTSRRKRAKVNILDLWKLSEESFFFFYLGVAEFSPKSQVLTCRHTSVDITNKSNSVCSMAFMVFVFYLHIAGTFSVNCDHYQSW